MATYLFITFLNFILVYLSRSKYSVFIILSTTSYILFLLPSTGMDYDYYKADYISAHYIPNFPFFRTTTILTAEPFYKWYTAFISVITNLSFEEFLSLNFIILYGLIFNLFKKYFQVFPSLLFMVFGLMAIVPTIFYFSPRSSISFVLSILAFFYFVDNKNIKGLFISFLTIGFHSQFIPMLGLLFLSSICYKFLTSKLKLYLFMFCIFIILYLLLKMPFYVYSIFSNIIGSLPTGEFINTKLHYFSNESSTVRITAVLSIVIFPILYYFLANKNIILKVMKENLPKCQQKNLFFY